MMNSSLGLIIMKGSEEFGSAVEYYLKKWHDFDGTYVIKAECPRFSTGEAKGYLKESVRSKDIFIICDIFNYSVTYQMYGMTVPMSPDDHFQDIKRIISAIGGKAKRISVIMPMLYEGRQHKRTHRESLDCAMMLQELTAMGVSNIITFDAHDPRVQNAIPLEGFDNMQPTYQMLKALVRSDPEIKFDPAKLIMVSPDEGGVGRCLQYSSSLKLDLGMFYKRRNLSKIVDGMNPIEAHEYIGNDLHGKTAIVADDMISSGGSMIDTFHSLKEKGAEKIYAFITFGLFCNGLEKFDKAYAEGIFDKIFITNLNYRTPELKEREWCQSVDLSKYTAYAIDALHLEKSISSIIDPHGKITALVEKTQNR